MQEKESEKIEKISSSIWGFFVVKRAVAWLFLLAVIILGIYSAITLPREIQPEVNVPYIMVSTYLPGANPSDTELLLTKPLEKQIATASDIKNLTSSSSFGLSFIFAEFEAKVDVDDSLQQVKDAVEKVKQDLPKDASSPQVQKMEMNEFPIITFSVTGNLPVYELTKITKTVQEELEKIKGVSKIKILGGEEKYIKVKIDSNRLNEYNLSIDQVSSIIKYSNINLPIGLISSDKLNYSVRIDNRLTSIEDIQNLPLFSTKNSDVILLKDIAEISESLPQKNTISNVSVKGNKSLTAVSLQVYKKTGSNIVDIAEKTKEKVEEMKQNDTIPKSINIIVTNDNSFFVTEELGNLTSNGIQTAIFIVITLFLALGLTQGIIAGMTIPITFLMTFPVLDYFDMSFNVLSLFALVMSLGITIDTTVVIMEGMYENLKKGFTPKDSALLSINMYKWPLIAGTLTNIFAFFPMLLVSGIMGEFLKTMPITITATLIASLFLALTIAPSIAAKFIKHKKETEEHHSILEPFFAWSGEKFYKWLKEIFAKKSKRILTMLTIISAFALSIALPISGILKVEMFPPTDQTYFTIAIEAPKGLIVSETEKIVKDIEEYLYKIPEVENFVTQIGTTQSIALTEDTKFMGQGSLTESNIANITVNLAEKDKREKESFMIAETAREHFKNYQKAKINVNEIKEGPPSEDPITVRITGKDLEKLKEISKQVEEIIKKTQGTNTIKSSLKSGIDEFEFILDPGKIAKNNLTIAQASIQIRDIIQGIKSTDITFEDEDKSIFIEYDFEKTDGKTNLSINDIENLQILTPKGNSIPLSELGSYKLVNSISEIQREDQNRIIKITSATNKDINAVEINQKISEEIGKIELPSGYEISYGGDLEEIRESFMDLFRVMIIGIILIAGSLVMMFNSFRQPLIILFTLPLALIGVFPGLLLIGLNLSFPAFLGVVSLCGIVVSNGIVLIDRINENIQNNVEFSEAIVEATKSRIEPIVMTAITTILGVIPLSLSNAFWAGLGFTIAFGQMFSTILLLVVIPILYYSFEKKRN
ncbi:MAG: efflux RND transporter permease subunit [Candidatus Gracilibacteria bacterium]|jgi:HAE1 family hydrophobic/amphiphilic exporter-1